MVKVRQREKTLIKDSPVSANLIIRKYMSVIMAAHPSKVKNILK
jgi:hypothetical protein